METNIFTRREELISIIDGCRMVLKNDGKWLKKEQLREVQSRLGKANWELTEINKELQRRREQAKEIKINLIKIKNM